MPVKRGTKVIGDEGSKMQGKPKGGYPLQRLHVNLMYRK